MAQAFFSVVIPTLNERNYLPLLLQDLVEQSLTDFEVIIVDGKSEDGTVDLANEFADRLELTTISSSKRNVSVQRNLGGKKAGGKWVLFLDADSRLPNYFLEGIGYNLHKAPTVDIFTTWSAPEQNTKTNLALTHLMNITLELYSLTGKQLTYGACIGCRRQIVQEVQFDTTQKVFEDSKFVASAIAKGYHYQIFRDPKYVFNQRRLRKEGILKITGSTALLQLRYLTGGDFSKRTYGYDMNGGQAHLEPREPLTATMAQFLRQASQRQRQRARRIAKMVIDAS